MDLVHLKKEDCNEVVSLIDDVFTVHNNSEMNVRKDQPRIYCENDVTMGYHIAAKKDGKICGVAANFPVKYSVFGEVINCGYIGNVVVDSSYRNQGIMQKILGKIMEETEENNIDMYFLLGDRWRYKHFGFERCGYELKTTTRKSMLREITCKAEYEFLLVDKEDTEYIDKIYELLSKNVRYVKRDREIFYETLIACQNSVYAYISDNDFKGFLVVDSKKDSVLEYGITEKSEFMKMVKNYVDFSGIERIHISCGFYDDIKNYILPYCETYMLAPSFKYKIINFPKIIVIYMKAKSYVEELEDGVITIDSDIFGKWSITKENDNIYVNRFEGKADFVFTGDIVYQFLFGLITPDVRNVSAKKRKLAKNWFPLPLDVINII